MRNRLGFGRQMIKRMSNWRRTADSWSKYGQRGRRLSLEPLEERQLLAVVSASLHDLDDATISEGSVSNVVSFDITVEGLPQNDHDGGRIYLYFGGDAEMGVSGSYDCNDPDLQYDLLDNSYYVVFPEDVSTSTITIDITINNDTIAEFAESASLILRNGSYYEANYQKYLLEVDNSDIPTTTILDNDWVIEAVNAVEPTAAPDDPGANEAERTGAPGMFVIKLLGDGNPDGASFTVDLYSDTAVLDDNGNGTIEGDYEVRDAGGTLISDDATITVPAGETSFIFTVTPFYDGLGNDADEVIEVTIAGVADTQVDTNLNEADLTIREPSLRLVPQIDIYSYGDEDGGPLLGVDPVSGMAVAGDLSSGTLYYSGYADNKVTIVASSVLTTHDEEDHALTYVKAEPLCANISETTAS